MFGSGKRGSYFLQSCHDQLACASVSSSSARPNVGRYLPKFNSKSARNAVTDVADLGAARLLPKSFHHQSPGRKPSIQTAALPHEPFLPREKTSTNGVNGETNRKVTLDFWLAAWHRFR